MIATISFREDLDAYLAHLRSEGGAALKTLPSVRNTLAEFLAWAEKGGVRNLYQPTPQAMRHYEEHLRLDHKLLAPAIQSKRETIQALYEWLFLYGAPDRRAGIAA